MEKEAKKITGASHPKKFEARASDRHHKDYILLLFVGLAHKFTHVCFLFSFFFLVTHHLLASGKTNSGIANVVAHFPSNKGWTSNIRIPRNSLQLHPAPCMCDVCRVHGLGLSRVSKQNVLSLILLISLANLMNQKRGICRHRILYPLRLRPSFPNNTQTLGPKASLEPNQISNWLEEC